MFNDSDAIVDTFFKQADEFIELQKLRQEEFEDEACIEAELTPYDGCGDI